MGAAQRIAVASQIQPAGAEALAPLPGVTSVLRARNGSRTEVRPWATEWVARLLPCATMNLQLMRVEQSGASGPADVAHGHSRKACFCRARLPVGKAGAKRRYFVLVYVCCKAQIQLMPSGVSVACTREDVEHVMSAL